MAELKTKPTGHSVEAFLRKATTGQKREDAFALLSLFREVTGEEPRMWGPSIVGFGDYRFTNDRGQGSDWFLTGFSPRKQTLTLYLMGGVEPHRALLAKLGKHKTAKSCLYLNRLSEIDLGILREVVRQSLDRLTRAPKPP